MLRAVDSVAGKRGQRQPGSRAQDRIIDGVDKRGPRTTHRLVCRRRLVGHLRQQQPSASPDGSAGAAVSEAVENLPCLQGRPAYLQTFGQPDSPLPRRRAVGVHGPLQCETREVERRDRRATSDR